MTKIIAMTGAQMLSYLATGAIPESFPEELKDLMKDPDVRNTMQGQINQPDTSPEFSSDSFADFLRNMLDGSFLEDEKSNAELDRTGLFGDCPCPACSLRRVIDGSKEADEQQDESDLPDNVQGLYNGTLIERVRLNTKDGRVIGNATIACITSDTTGRNIHVVTDDGEIKSLTTDETVAMFHQPQYILKAFPNDEDGTVTEALNEWYDETFDLNQA